MMFLAGLAVALLIALIFSTVTVFFDFDTFMVTWTITVIAVIVLGIWGLTYITAGSSP